MKAYHLKVTLNNVKPPVWREIIIPAGISFEQLHTAIQIAMGWMDYHLYEFTIDNTSLTITCDEETYNEYLYFKTPEGKKQLEEMQRKGMTFTFPAEMRLPDEETIDDFLEQYGKFKYTYDLGDGWDHMIELKNVIQNYTGYPKVLKYNGACPPEDCGGVYGYEESLAALNDPEHPEHKDRLEWSKAQGYGDYDKEFANGELEAEFGG
jgi:hypothetical protein